MKKILLSSYRFKLVGAYSIVIIISLFTFSYWIYTETADWFAQNIDNSLISTSKNIETYLNRQIRIDPLLLSELELDSFGIDDQEAIIDDSKDAFKIFSMVYESLDMNPKRYFIQVLNNNGRIVWRSNNLDGARLPTFPKPSEINDLKTFVESVYSYDTIPTYVYRKQLKGMPGDSIFLSVPFRADNMRIFISKSKYFTVTLGYSRKSMDLILKDFSQYFYYGMPIIAILLISLLFFVFKLAYQPLENIGSSISKLNLSNLSLELPYVIENDEFGKISSTIITFTEKIRVAFQKSQDFAYDASHELKTPLTILRGELELALNNSKSVEEYQAVIASCLDEILRLNNLVENILEISRAEHGKVRLMTSRTNITEFVEDIVEDIEIIADSKSISVTNDLAKGIVATLDRDRMHQALLNILENAVKYTPENGKIFVKLWGENGQFNISVEDTGFGIPEAQIPLIFERFFRADLPNGIHTVGTGLGLSISKWIIEAHNGLILVESAQDLGTKFTITLPRN